MPFKVPTEGYILDADAYPHDENFIAFDLMYCESEEQLKSHDYSHRRFYVRKDIAQTLTKQVIDILAAPDTETAWDEVMRNIPEAHEPDLSTDFEDLKRLAEEQEGEQSGG
jgi:hypothetical protein